MISYTVVAINMERQLNCALRNPPITGPSDRPRYVNAVERPSIAPRFSGGYMATSVAILVANMEYLALDEEDAYRKVGQVRKAGFRIFSVDDGELKMKIRFRAEKERKIR